MAIDGIIAIVALCTTLQDYSILIGLRLLRDEATLGGRESNGPRRHKCQTR